MPVDNNGRKRQPQKVKVVRLGSEIAGERCFNHCESSFQTAGKCKFLSAAQLGMLISSKFNHTEGRFEKEYLKNRLVQPLAPETVDSRAVHRCSSFWPIHL